MSMSLTKISGRNISITATLLLALAAFSCFVAARAQDTNVRSVSSIASVADFDRLARVYTDTNYALPHVLFVIDRKDKDKIYYVNTKLYGFHKDFVNGTYLSLERGREFFENNYLKLNRRFIMGTLAYQSPVKRYTFEFWEGDTISSDQIKLASDIINKTFFAPVAFKPNSTRQDEASASVKDLQRVLESDIAKEQQYEPLNIAHGLGRIHIIKKLDEHVEIGFNEILVLDEVPISLPPVKGIITTKPSTPLSHINLLAKSWGVPNAYIKNAAELFKQYDGWWVSFDTLRDTYKIKRADVKEIDEYQKRLKVRLDIMTPRYNLNEKRLTGLREQRAKDVIAYGAKSANLGELMHARLQNIVVPDGFTIPFFYYDQFLKENKLDAATYEMLNDQKFVHDPAYRRARLAAFREKIKQGTINQTLRAEVLRHAHQAEFAGQSFFARSSTNSEDLPNFNGAGLYSSMPNLRGDDQLIEGIKSVWASVWNYEAYEARERSNIDHAKIFMAVLIQQGINSESSGVMITTDPYDRANKNAVYISAKRGLGMKVVEGQKIAEQIIFRPEANAVRVLTRSAEDSLLTFDEKGGIKEIPIPDSRAVLTDDVIRGLARAATEIKSVFKNREQDIEWAVVRGQIYIVQSRPFIAGS